MLVGKEGNKNGGSAAGWTKFVRALKAEGPLASKHRVPLVCMVSKDLSHSANTKEAFKLA